MKLKTWDAAGLTLGLVQYYMYDRNPTSMIRNPTPMIRNPIPMIRNPNSMIRNPTPIIETLSL